MKTIVITYKDAREQTVIAGDIEEYYCTEKMFFVKTDHMSFYFSLDEISQIYITEEN